MKVVTVKQPFATLIAKGYKEYEFRSWKTKYRGELLIHAGLNEDRKVYERFKHLDLEYPKGVIVAKVSVVDCVKIDREFANKLSKKDSHVYGDFSDNNEELGYAWKLDNIKEIKSEANIKGKLSIWNLDY